MAVPVEEPVKQKQSTAWRALLSLSALAVVGVAWYRHDVPTMAAGAYVFFSAVTFALYAKDKSAAGTNRQRTPEATLHLWSLLGGWPGALLAQHLLRHKSRKTSFQRAFWMTALINVGAVVWMATSEAGAPLRSLLLEG